MDRFERIASRVVSVVMASGIGAEDYQILLDEVIKGNAVLTAQDLHRHIPTIHNISGKYRDTLDHVGGGMFEGKTEHGRFEFEGGGAMHRTSGGISWTRLNTFSPAVLRDLDYDLNRVRQALEELIAKSSVNV